MTAITACAHPGKAAQKIIGAGLAEGMKGRLGSVRIRPIWLLSHAADGTLQGGLKAETRYGWLYVEQLWVAETCRGQGLGSALLEAAEAEARRSGCAGVHLHTLAFQAPAFYAKRGYRQVGQLDGLPPGAASHWFAKPFEEG